MKKLRRHQSWERRALLRKTLGVGVKTARLLGRGGGGAGDTQAGQAGWQGELVAG